VSARFLLETGKQGGINAPFCSGSRHSKVISNSYLSVNLAGLLITLTPRRETTDILAVVWRCLCCITVDESNVLSRAVVLQSDVKKGWLGWEGYRGRESG
jgi:hypothetical protein